MDDCGARGAPWPGAFQGACGLELEMGYEPTPHTGKTQADSLTAKFCVRVVLVSNECVSE